MLKKYKLTIRTYSGNGFYSKTTTNTYSPIPGIVLMVDNVKKPLKINWCCLNMVDKIQTRRAFSIRKYGYQGAWERAAELRVAHTGMDIQQEAPKPPEWLEEWLRRNS
jgi:hypothetical protein